MFIYRFLSSESETSKKKRILLDLPRANKQKTKIYNLDLV